MSIEDSGLWTIDGPLGRLLRITDFKMGTGSLWFESTLAVVAIDIGVVQVSEASFRVTFETDGNGDLAWRARVLAARSGGIGRHSGNDQGRVVESRSSRVVS